MRDIGTYLVVLLCLSVSTLLAQNELQRITSKDSIIKSSWNFGLGYNIVDDSGDAFGNLVDIQEQWNTTALPNRIAIGRYFKSGIGLEAIGGYNKYQIGKRIEGRINTEQIDYFSIDTRVSYDLNRIFGGKGWFDPYIGVGFGYTDANKEGTTTYNAVVGFRTWITDQWGIDLNSSGKWRTGDTGTNHIQHAAGVVYQFGIEKGLSKRGLEKLAMIKGMESERQRLADSTAIAQRKAEEAATLAKRLAEEKEAIRLAQEAQAKRDAENKIKTDLEAKIKNIGYVNFDLNSSYLNAASQAVLDKLVLVLTENTGVHLEVSSHTDSRGKSSYNKWLSDRRVKRTIDYLIAQGIDATRLKSESFGEENLLNECDDNTYCPEEKHRINRRSEFKIMKY